MLFQAVMENSIQDIKRFQKVATERGGLGKMRSMRRTYFMLGGICLACGILLLYTRLYLPLMIAAFVIGALYMLPAIFFTSFAARGALRAIPKQERETVFGFDDQGLSATNAAGRKFYEYGEFQHLFEDGEYYYLFLPSPLGYVIRKTAFTIGEAGALGAFLEEKTGKKMEALK